MLRKLNESSAARSTCKPQTLGSAAVWCSPYNLNVGDAFHESLRLRAETDQALLDFIRTDLGVCLTFAAVAKTSYSMGHREHAERTIAEAEKGYSDMHRFFLRARGMTPDVEKELQSKFNLLRQRLDGLQRLRQS
jgi:hypothetical protein